MNVTKNNGELEEFSMDKIKETYKRICYGLNTRCPFSALEENIKRYIVPEIKTSAISEMIVKSAIDLISTENTAWEHIAGRFSVLNLYKKAKKQTGIEEKELYDSKNYLALFKDYVSAGHYYKDFMNFYSEDDILEAGAYIDGDRDYTYNHTTVLMYAKRYLLNPNGIVRELPQHMYMSIGLFLAIPEEAESRLSFAKKVYDACSKGEVSLPTPTLLNARTNYHQLSSCFELNVGDDLRNIFHNVENMAQISKYGGGIGVYLGNIRSKGGSIRGVNGTSGGVMPWTKIINDTAIAVNQLGARAGAISVTLDVFHLDIYHFLDMQTETGDIRSKAFDLFPSVSFPDLFMERMEANEQWTLFCPHEIERITGKRLQDHFGEDFNTLYKELEKDDRLKLKQETNAKELFKEYLKATVETGMPYAFFRDTVNKLNPNKHAGNIYHTNLCVEIQQNTSSCEFIEETVDGDEVMIKYIAGETVVCNLASINCAKVHTPEKIEEVTAIVTRLLDNVIELNFYPIKEAELTSKKYRPIGIGFLGLAQLLAENKLNYDSIEARDYTDGLFKEYSFNILRNSVDLAKERGAYPLFEGSEWSKGMFNGEFIADKFANGLELQMDMEEHGTRFGYHMAPAPNSSTAMVVGTTASVLPIYKKYFVETNAIAPSVNVAPNLSAETFWFYKEYVNMDMNEVIDMMAVIYKWIDQSISFEWMINPQKTSPANLYAYYMKAWKEGIKTVYYVRSQSLSLDDCDSCSG